MHDICRAMVFSAHDAPILESFMKSYPQECFTDFESWPKENWSVSFSVNALGADLIDKFVDLSKKLRGCLLLSATNSGNCVIDWHYLLLDGKCVRQWIDDMYEETDSTSNGAVDDEPSRTESDT